MRPSDAIAKIIAADGRHNEAWRGLELVCELHAEDICAAIVFTGN
jgi:hypothetical protein